MTARPTGYDLASYGDMITCEPRMSAYAEALKRAIRPGSVVFDIGAGVGGFALLACKFGASEVVAIEPNPAIEILRRAAAANGYAEQIRIVRGLSSDFTPDRKADVIVFDLRGIMPFFEGHIGSVVDMRERLLADGGVLIPGRDRLFVALVEDGDGHRRMTMPWLSNGHGIDLASAYRHIANRDRKADLAPGQLLSAPSELATIDYYRVHDPDLDASFALVADRPATCHGLAVWFDAELVDGVGFSNAPSAPTQVYGQMILPLETPVTLDAGDRVEGTIAARLVGNRYIWAWSGTVRGSAGEKRASFRQSTFLREIFPPDALQRHAANAIPRTGERLAADRRILDLVDGVRSLGEIAAIVELEYPACFQAPGSAMDRVTALDSAYVEVKDG